MNPDGLHFRMTSIAVVVACLFGALFVRLWYLQVLNTTSFQQAAQLNDVRLVDTPAPRGRILDRNGKVIVDNQVVNVMTVDRATMTANPDVVDRLAALLGEPQEALKLAIADPRYSPLAPVPVAQPDSDQITIVEEDQSDFPGVSISQQVVREYPYGSLAAQLLGYVGEINESELTAHKGQGYKPGDDIGKSGIELAYEQQLRGVAGVTKYNVNSAGQVISKAGSNPPIQGHDVRLTIDVDIQNLAEQSLAQGLASARGTVDRNIGSQFAGNTYPAPGGAVIVQDPSTGQILALASQPSYNPTQFVNGISTALFAQLTAPSANQPLTDRATSGLYAPGSTFKLVTAAAALDRGLITPTSPFYDKGFIKEGGQIFRNDGGNAYGTVDLGKAITVSDDSYFYTLGAQFWDNGRSLAIQDTAKAFGFGAPTGIAIGGEPPGLVPDPTTRRKEYEEFPGDYLSPNWFTGDNINLAIGQGELTATPLQLSNAYSAFANGGTLYQPQVALDFENQQGVKLQNVAPHVIRQVPLSPADQQAMLAGFEGVVNFGNGTAYGAFASLRIPGVTIAGKTGTAQVTGKEPTSVFVGWAPAVNPQYMVTVIEEQAGYGASTAAPVARRIFQGLFNQTLTPPNYINNAAVN